GYRIDLAIHAATESRPCTAIPLGYAVCGHSSCCGEESTHVHIAATDGYCIDMATIPTASEGRPSAAVPLGYVACRHPSCCGEVTTHIHIAATDGYCEDIAIHT